MAAIGLIFGLLVELTSLNPLEVEVFFDDTTGLHHVIGLFEETPPTKTEPGTTSMRHFVGTPDTGFQQVAILDVGLNFSVTELVRIQQFLYVAAVCGFQACLYRYDLQGATDWERRLVVATLQNVSTVRLALVGAALALTVQTFDDAVWFFEALPVLIFADLVFNQLRAFSGIASPTRGGQQAATAFAPNGDSCALTRFVTGELVALCVVAGIVQSILLESLEVPVAGDQIAARAIWAAGYFYFSYILASGAVHLAKTNGVNPLAAIVPLGLLSVVPFEIVGLAMVLQGDYLYAFWPGAAVQIALATLFVASIPDFPLERLGPMAAVVVGTLLFAIAVYGNGASLDVTVLSQVEPVPLLAVWLLGALVLLLLGAVIWRARAGARGGSGPEPGFA